MKYQEDSGNYDATRNFPLRVKLDPGIDTFIHKANSPLTCSNARNESDRNIKLYGNWKNETFSLLLWRRSFNFEWMPTTLNIK